MLNCRKAAAIAIAAAMAMQPPAGLLAVPGRENAAAANAQAAETGEAIPGQPETPDFPNDAGGEEAPVGQVTGLAVKEYTDSQIHLVWDALSNVAGYEVCRYDSDTDAYEKIQTIEGSQTTAFTDTGLLAGTIYEYVVRAYRQDSAGAVSYGDDSAVLSATTGPKAVSGFSVKLRTYLSVGLKWEAVEGADGYRIFRYNEETEQFEKVKTIANGKKTTWHNKGLEAGTRYYYVIRAYLQNDTGTYWSQNSEEVTVKTRTKAVTGFRLAGAGKNSIRLCWDKVSGADGYMIYRKGKDGYYYGRVKAIKGGDILTWTDKGLSSNKNYKYRMAGYVEDGGKKYIGHSSSILKVKTTK